MGRFWLRFGSVLVYSVYWFWLFVARIRTQEWSVDIKVKSTADQVEQQPLLLHLSLDWWTAWTSQQEEAAASVAAECSAVWNNKALMKPPARSLRDPLAREPRWIKVKSLFIHTGSFLLPQIQILLSLCHQSDFCLFFWLLNSQNTTVRRRRESLWWSLHRTEHRNTNQINKRSTRPKSEISIFYSLISLCGFIPPISKKLKKSIKSSHWRT